MSLHLYLGRVAIDGAITAGSHTLTSSLLLATSADIGKGIDVLGAGASGKTLVTTISAVGSGSVTLADAASTTVGPVEGLSDGATITVWTACNPLRAGTQYDNSLTNRDGMSFQLDRSKNPGVTPVVGQPVLLTDSTDLFGGSIDSVDLTQIPGNISATFDCQCISWESLASKRTTGQPNDATDYTPKDGKFSGCAAGGIFTWLINHCMATDVSAPQVETGPTIPEIDFSYTDCASAFDSVVQSSSDNINTYLWRIDARRNPYFELQSSVAAPWNIINSDVLVGFSLSRTREKYVNRAFVTPANDTGFDNTLVKMYQLNTAVDERSSVEGGTGFYDTVVSAGDANTTVDADTLAESIAKAYGKIPSKITYSTYRSGLRAGMLQSIILSDLGINGSYLISSVSMDTSNGVPLYNVEAVDGALIGDWRTALTNLGNNSAGFGYSAVGGATSGTSTGASGVPTVDILNVDTVLSPGSQFVLVHAITRKPTITLPLESNCLHVVDGTTYGDEITIQLANDSIYAVDIKPTVGDTDNGSSATYTMTTIGQASKFTAQ